MLFFHNFMSHFIHFSLLLLLLCLKTFSLSAYLHTYTFADASCCLVRHSKKQKKNECNKKRWQIVNKYLSTRKLLGREFLYLSALCLFWFSKKKSRGNVKQIFKYTQFQWIYSNTQWFPYDKRWEIAFVYSYTCWWILKCEFW